ncbi:putative RNA-directed DNA polymerase from transposon X-element [Araneus ventricosus]|uniref:Putative RNA-directed DNA polymerase from transposon X-element n=1 Tax=Araneus ventricosus TaxID=182803 RepID=A0A4Y2V0C2_ARAVE|nr:putative RNA-directed DNA polymerase from transposon X-element [Araneus ventricosus]
MPANWIFPKTWKTAKLVLINKAGKNPEDPKSYRPICLLPVISKVLDKLITQRVTHHLSTQNLLNPKQHGFRAGKSCDTAGLQLWRQIQTLMKNKGKVCVVSLDVAGAFDNVWRPAILHYLAKAECPNNLYRLISDYLADRKILFQHNNSSWTFDSTRGVPQALAVVLCFGILSLTPFSRFPYRKIVSYRLLQMTWSSLLEVQQNKTSKPSATT